MTAEGLPGHVLNRWRLRTLVSAVVAFVMLLGVGLTSYVVRLLEQNARESQQGESLARLSEVRARIEGELNGTLYIAQGLLGFVAVQSDLTDDQFRSFVSEITRVDRNIRIIALAPGNVVRFIHPLKGNEAVIGLDYSKSEQQWSGVRRAMQDRNPVVAGPVDLVQGGRALIARIPVLVPTGGGGHGLERGYWGMASIVIDSDRLFTRAGLLPEVDGHLFALRGVDGAGAEGGVILGDAALFAGDAVTMPVTLPDGSWQLASRPVGGWDGTSREAQVALVIGIVVSMVVAALSALVVSAQQRSRSMALHDPLTGLPNRRLLVDRMEQLADLSERTGLGFQVFFVDLNGFKPINDTYGHAAGDAVLQEVGARLQRETRDVDTIARIGGDEFVVVVPGGFSQTTVRAIVERLREAVCAPVRVGEHQIVIQASVGYAFYPDDAATIPELLELADQRMYRAKVEVPA